MRFGTLSGLGKLLSVLQSTILKEKSTILGAADEFEDALRALASALTPATMSRRKAIRVACELALGMVSVNGGPSEFPQLCQVIDSFSREE